MELVFTSELQKHYRDQFENLFFFNVEQKKFHAAIEDTIQVIGAPEILKDRDTLWIHLPKFPDAQCLFALDKSEKLFASMVYFRSEISELEVFHIALLKKTLSEQQCIQLLFNCIKTMKKIAKQINGVKWLVLPYGRGKIRV